MDKKYTILEYLHAEKLTCSDEKDDNDKMCDEDCKIQVESYESCAQQAVESGDCDEKMEGDEMDECLEDFCYDEMLSVQICENSSPNCENWCPDCSSQIVSYYQCIYNGRTDHCTDRDDETEVDGEGNTAMDQCAQALCTMQMTAGMTCMEQNNCGDDEPQPEPTCAQGCHICNGSGSEDCQICEEGFKLQDDDNDGTGECIAEDGEKTNYIFFFVLTFSAVFCQILRVFFLSRTHDFL